MNEKSYALDGEQPARLRIGFDGSAARISLDGAPPVLVRTRELKQGWSHALEDGSMLEVKLIRRGFMPALAILRDGRHIPASPSYPPAMLRSSSNALFVLAALVALDVWRRLDWLAVFALVMYVPGAVLLRRGHRLAAALIVLPAFIDLDIIVLGAFTGTLRGRSWIFAVFADLLFMTFAVSAYQSANDLRLGRFHPRRDV